MRIDLHSHSTHSDGVLAPAALVLRAASRGVDVLALTDHDELGGVAEAITAARALGIMLIPGVEISVTWAERTVHVIGLGVDPIDPELERALRGLRASRRERAVLIAKQLDAAGIPDSLNGAASFTTDAAAVGRAHFARYLVARGFARNASAAFKRYLTPGRPGFVAHRWAGLGQAIYWIRGAGGCAVLAHPERYRLPPLQLHALFEQFRQCGGSGIEISADARKHTRVPLLRLVKHFGFALSVGSDFHAPGAAADLGDTAVVPAGYPTVWDAWDGLRRAA